MVPVPCPAGSYTSVTNTALPGPGDFPQCTQCPSGFFCPQGSITPSPCGVGFHSPAGAVTCQNCPAGYFCGSNTTSTELLSTAAGLWNMRGSLFGRCYNGTYCPSGMTREPTLDSNACPQGNYCPMATPTPIYCPAGNIQLQILLLTSHKVLTTMLLVKMKSLIVYQPQLDFTASQRQWYPQGPARPVTTVH